MKKTNIALAIFSAIALAACGGSSNDDAVGNSSIGAVQPGINNGNTGIVQPGINNGNTNINTDDTNTDDTNTDDTNTGNTNTGNTNTGNTNTGNTNTGNTNTGNTNTGNTNTGNTNTGNANTGNTNTGNTNTGNTNTGNTNTGNANTGNANTGNTNTGNTNTDDTYTDDTYTDDTYTDDTYTDDTNTTTPNTSVVGATEIEIRKDDGQYYGFSNGTLESGQLSNGDEVKRAIFTLGDNETNIRDVAFIQNPGLLDENNKLKGSESLTPEELEKISDNLYYFDKESNLYLLVRSEGGKLFTLDNTELTEQDLYVEVAPASNFSFADEIRELLPITANVIKKVNILNDELPVGTKDGTDEIELPKINRSATKLREISTLPISYVLELNQSQQKIEGSELVPDLDENGNATNLTRDVEVKSNHKTKVYNLPYVMTGLLLNKHDHIEADSANNHFLPDIKDGILTYGDKTPDLPEDVTASYAGVAFTQEYEAKFGMNVAFGKNADFKITDVSITDRHDALLDTTLKDLKMAEASTTIDNYKGNDSFIVDLTYADDSGFADGAKDIDKIKGSFYGSNAENVAGTLHHGNDDATGVFSAETTDTTK